MAIVSCGALIDALRRLGVLTPAQLAQLPHIIQGRFSDVRMLARVLLQRGWLTIYQVNELLADRGQGLVIGPYVVLDRLGQGGLSQVFKASHREHGWVVALKVLRPEALAGEEGREQFLQEMEAMARLDHPNIVEFCDVDQFGDTCYFAMEFVEGTDLGKLVRLLGLLPVAQACEYVRQTALGLQHAHERNLVHRDIKPMNLFLTQPPSPCAPAYPGTVPAKPTRHGLIKILDWGLANLRPPGSATPEENQGKAVIGTADYLSPEQARNADGVDIRADIYSLGCTLYYLLAGQPPFPHGTLMEKLIRHQRDEPEPLEHLRDDMPLGVADVIERMMAKAPAERYQTPAAVALALLPYTRAQPAKGSDTPRKPSPAAVPFARKHDTPLPLQLKDIGERPGIASSRREHSDTACP